jgi:TonB family protein
MRSDVQVRLAVIVALAVFLSTSIDSQTKNSGKCPQPEIQPTALDVTLHYYKPICGINPPKILEDPDPEWPDLSLKIKHGSALLWIGVGEDGGVRDVVVEKSSRKEFGEKSVEAVRKWKFAPAMKDGHPVPVAMEVTTNFER